jgi:hypothetical protein
VVGDQDVNPMEENNDINIIENGRINWLIHDIFAPIDVKLDYTHDVTLIEN